MKTLPIIFSIMVIVTLNSCTQKTDTNVMLQDSKTRTEIFTTITENQDYMTEFMENMQNSQHAMQMMEGNQKMMGNMMKMMHENGIMSEDCLQSCIKMMGDKGMYMMTDEDKKNENTDDDHTEHH